MAIDLSQVTNIHIPEGDVTAISVGGVTIWQAQTKELTSITLSGQTTTFDKGATFSFGGTVTAHYSDSTTANVTSSTTFSGYNMSTAGTQTVTASYTENGVTKTATYTITVNELYYLKPKSNNYYVKVATGTLSFDNAKNANILTSKAQATKIVRSGNYINTKSGNKAIYLFKVTSGNTTRYYFSTSTSTTNRIGRLEYDTTNTCGKPYAYIFVGTSNRSILYESSYSSSKANTYFRIVT